MSVHMHETLYRLYQWPNYRITIKVAVGGGAKFPNGLRYSNILNELLVSTQI